jgi:adenosylcobyric acid synthase
VRGCYLHGLFSSDVFRGAILSELGGTSNLAFTDSIETTLDALAKHIESHLDLDLLLKLADTPGCYSNS